MKVGLALGGGGARGLAHLGVLQVLEEERIPVHVLAGTSFGAVVAGLYAVTRSAAEAEKRLIRFLQGPRFQKIRLDFIRGDFEEGRQLGFLKNIAVKLKRQIFYGVAFSRRSYISQEDFFAALAELLDDVPIEKTLVRCAVAATDLISGREVILDRGPLARAVAASCALPGVFPPVEVGRTLLVDGGWVSRVPVEAARAMGARLVMAVDASEDVKVMNELKTGLDILLRADELTRDRLCRLQLREADVVIHPQVGSVHWSDFTRVKECIEAGQAAARLQIPVLKRLLWRRKVWGFLRRKRR